jgi:hypothetical protein
MQEIFLWSFSISPILITSITIYLVPYKHGPYEIEIPLYALIIMCMLLFFLILGQRWLASTWSSWRGRPETATGCLLLPWATPLLLPCAMRWKAPAAATPLLLPHTRRRLHRMARWRCGWRLLQHTWTHRATTMSAPTSKRWAHMNTDFRF